MVETVFHVIVVTAVVLVLFETVENVIALTAVVLL